MKKMYVLFVLLFGCKAAIYACPLCNKEVRDAIYDSRFYPNLLTMLSAFIVLGIIVAAMSAITIKRHNKWVAANRTVKVLSPVPLTTASIVLGIGLGGFADGIALHQVLQVHEMLSNKIAATTYIGKSVNMFWDGIFHAFCLLVVLIGVVLLWKLLGKNDIDRAGKLLAGGLLTGWGVFNVVEGVIDHQLLKLHNVVEYASDHDPANYTFLGVSVVMLLIGYMLIRNENTRRYSADRTS